MLTPFPAPIVRLAAAAKRLDDYVACRLGAVVADEVRAAIYAEHAAAVAEALPFFAPADGGIVHGIEQAAPVGDGRAVA